MRDLSQIVVATDLSEHAKWPIVRGATLAGRHGGQLHLMHAIPQFSLKDLSESYRPYGIVLANRPHWVDAARAQMHALATIASERFGIAIEEHAKFGSAVPEIESITRKLPADLLVVGAHGRGFPRDLLLGSTVSALMDRTVCPLLISKTESDDPYRSVLVGIDFSNSCRSALEFASFLAPDAAVAALYAVENDVDSIFHAPRSSYEKDPDALRGAQRELDNFVDEAAAQHPVERIADWGNAAQTLLTHARSSDADLIVVGKHHSNWKGVSFGDISKRVVKDATCDVLIVP